jgi:cytochrome c oxidase subunit II
VQQKWWSLLFGAVMLAATISVVISPLVGWGLPKNVSSYGPAVDLLFHVILVVTGFFFILTEAILVYFMYAFAGRGRPPVHPKPAEGAAPPGTFFLRVTKPMTGVIHDEHRLEVAWTLIPGVILFVLAVAQINTWLWIKDRNWMPKPEEEKEVQQMEVSARQFEWRVRYPSPERMKSWETDRKLADDFKPRRYLDKNTNTWIDNAGVQADDIHVVNEVHVWKGVRVLVHLTTRDVIHSFYLPNLRLKQDALPGKVIPVWFEATEANTKFNEETKNWEDGYDPEKGTWTEGGGSLLSTPPPPRHPEQIWELVCAELCGWGHYKMQGRLYVHETKEDFLKWLEHAEAEQRRSTP